MDIHINEAELSVLTYLHEHHEGIGEFFTVKTEVLTQALSLSIDEYAKAVSYLDDHRLVGLHAGYGETRADRNTLRLYSVCLTGLGEDYMRALESQPGLPGRITVAVLKESKGLILGVAGTVLGELFKRFIAPHG